MRINIQTRGFVISESLRMYIAQRMKFALGWAGARMKKLAVSLSDINGPRGGIDKRCKIQVQLVGGKDLVIEDTEADMYLAIDHAAERADRLLVRSLQRQRKIRRIRAPHKSGADILAMASDVADETGDVTRTRRTETITREPTVRIK